MPSGKLVRAAVGLVLVLMVAVAGYWILDAWQRNRAIETFEVAMAASRPGDVLDVSESFPLQWDRVVVVGPYEPGFSANEALGFEHFDEYEDLISGDSGQFIIFVKGRAVVGEIRNWGPTYFADDVRGFERDDALFLRSPDGLLHPAGPTT